MSPTPRAAVAVGVLAIAALFLPVAVVVLAVVAIAVATAVDARVARRRPSVERRVPTVLARGVASPLEVDVDTDAGIAVRVRQPAPPELPLDPREADGSLRATLRPARRGRYDLLAPSARCRGPLGLGRWDHTAPDATEVVVYPDLPAARRLAVAVRQGQFRTEGPLTRGPLGLGTDFETIRDYSPDDDVRQVNWRATQRLQRPMSNQYRVDQDRDVVCLVDAGRLMGAPVGDRTRLDAALDAVTAVALVADEVGDRCGAMAFDDAVRRSVSPRRRGSRAVVEALFDLEPSDRDSDYELGFRTVARTKRAFVLVLTDLLDETAARSLLDAAPVLARRHAVAVASITDPDLTALVRTPASGPLDAHAAAAAVDVLDARRLVVGRLRRAGVTVVEAPPDGLGFACVRTYLTMKSRARL